MDFWKSLGGIVTVELTSADPVAALQVISGKGILLIRVEKVTDLSFRCDIRYADLRILRKLAKKRGDTIRICGKRGLYWTFRGLGKRPVLIVGCLVLLLIILYMPSRVLFLQVEGNDRIPAAQILEAAEESGICFWASRREVRSEKMKNALLGALPELQWAGINTRGCLAIISVRERTLPDDSEERAAVCSIVAARDGIVESCTALEGNLLCQVGQAVKEGEVLISAFTDCGICIRVSSAQGEVFARTRRDISVVSLSKCLFQGGSMKEKQKYSLLVGKKRINLWKDSGIWQGTCDRMYEEYYITLPGGFSLPVAFVKETFFYSQSEEKMMEPNELQKSMTEAGRQYLTGQMIAGRILNGTETFSCEEDTCLLTGIYLCSEMIGRVQTEKIGE